MDSSLRCIRARNGRFRMVPSRWTSPDSLRSCRPWLSRCGERLASPRLCQRRDRGAVRSRLIAGRTINAAIQAIANYIWPSGTSPTPKPSAKCTTIRDPLLRQLGSDNAEVVSELTEFVSKISEPDHCSSEPCPRYHGAKGASRGSRHGYNRAVRRNRRDHGRVIGRARPIVGDSHRIGNVAARCHRVGRSGVDPRRLLSGEQTLIATLIVSA